MMLDCFDAQSTSQSVCAIFNVTRIQLESVLDAMIAEEDTAWFDSTRHFLKAVSRRLGNDRTFSGTYYFHFTRVPPGTDFAEGILPTTHVVDRLWQMVESLAPSQVNAGVLRRARSEILVSDDFDAMHYRLRMEAGMSGPFGQLVRSTIFNPTAQGLHFLRAPEMLEHICWFLKPKIGIDLSELYVVTTKPCLVKFRTPDTSDGVLGDALLYLYGCRKGEPPHWSWCFDGGGKPVPREEIVGVEWIEDRSGVPAPKGR